MAKAGSWAEVNVRWEGYDRIDFDKVKIRKTMAAIGRDIARAAKARVSKRGKSRAGQVPGRSSGALRASIRYKVSAPGFLVRVAPYGNSRIGSDFYPAYLHYGVRTFGRIKKAAKGEGVGKSNRRRRGARAELEAQKRKSGYRIEPRENYMVDALRIRRAHTRAVLARALQDALIPRKN